MKGLNITQSKKKEFFTKIFLALKIKSTKFRANIILGRKFKYTNLVEIFEKILNDQKMNTFCLKDFHNEFDGCLKNTQGCLAISTKNSCDV